MRCAYPNLGPQLHACTPARLVPYTVKLSNMSERRMRRAALALMIPLGAAASFVGAQRTPPSATLGSEAFAAVPISGGAVVRFSAHVEGGTPPRELLEQGVERTIEQCPSRRGAVVNRRRR